MPTTEGWPRRPTTLRTAVVLGSNGHPPRKSPHVGAPVWRRQGCAYPLALQGGVVHVLDVAESRRRASDRGAGGSGDLPRPTPQPPVSTHHWRNSLHSYRASTFTASVA